MDVKTTSCAYWDIWWKKINPFSPMMREVSLKTLPNVNIRDPSHDKNLPIMSVTGSINQNVFKQLLQSWRIGLNSNTLALIRLNCTGTHRIKI